MLKLKNILKKLNKLLQRLKGFHQNLKKRDISVFLFYSFFTYFIFAFLSHLSWLFVNYDLVFLYKIRLGLFFAFVYLINAGFKYHNDSKGIISLKAARMTLIIFFLAIICFCLLAFYHLFFPRLLYYYLAPLFFSGILGLALMALINAFFIGKIKNILISFIINWGLLFLIMYLAFICLTKHFAPLSAFIILVICLMAIMSLILLKIGIKSMILALVAISLFSSIRVLPGGFWGRVVDQDTGKGLKSYLIVTTWTKYIIGFESGENENKMFLIESNDDGYFYLPKFVEWNFNPARSFYNNYINLAIIATEYSLGREELTWSISTFPNNKWYERNNFTIWQGWRCFLKDFYPIKLKNVSGDFKTWERGFSLGDTNIFDMKKYMNYRNWKKVGKLLTNEYRKMYIKYNNKMTSFERINYKDHLMQLGF